MSWEAQRPVDGLVGELATGCTDLDTQISASVFTNLPVDYNQSIYIPLILADDSTGAYEVVYGYSHTSTSTSLTVSRGMRGTTAQAWSQGTVVRCAPTVYDSKMYMPAAQANTLTDAYNGMQVIGAGLGLLTKSYQGNFYGHVQFAGQALGPAVEGNALPPIGASPLIQAGHAVGFLTVGNGYFDYQMPGGLFPTGLTAVFTTIYTIASDDTLTTVKCHGSFNGNMLSFQCMGTNGLPLPNGTAVNFSVLAIGW